MSAFNADLSNICKIAPVGKVNEHSALTPSLWSESGITAELAPVCSMPIGINLIDLLKFNSFCSQ